MKSIPYPTAESEEELYEMQQQKIRKDSKKHQIKVCPYCLNDDCNCSDFDICGDFGDK